MIKVGEVMELTKENGENGNRRKTHIDLIECIGILFVLMYHSTAYKYDFTSDVSGIVFFRYLLRTVLSTCVPLFFFANGYLLLNRKFDLRKHIIKSIRIVILTGIWGIIGLLSMMNIEHQHLTIKEFVSCLWEWKPTGWLNHLWYMGALICIYVFFPLIKNVYDTSRKIFIYFVIICAMFTFGNVFICEAGTMVANVLLNKSKIYSGNLFNMFNPFSGIYGFSFVYFCVGGLAYNIEPKLLKIAAIKRNTISGITLIVGCLCLWGCGLYFTGLQDGIWDVVWNGYDTIFTFTNACMIYVLSLNYKKDRTLFRSVSASTLGIFFMHNIFVRLTKRYILTLPFMRTFIGNVIYAVLLLLICLAATLLLKKIPFVKKMVTL